MPAGQAGDIFTTAMTIWTIVTILTIGITMDTLLFTAVPGITQGEVVSHEQKSELASEFGLIIKGMTKEEARSTFGLLKPKVWHTSKGQKVWYYISPAPQNIYFIDGKVERVEYLPHEERSPESKGGGI